MPPNNVHVASNRRRYEKGKKVFEESTREGAPDLSTNDIESIPGALLARKTCSFVFIPDPSIGVHVGGGDHGCFAILGHYISIGMDFSQGLKNPVYIAIHEHALKHVVGGVQAVRRGRPVSWGAYFIFLDLPFGGHPIGGGVPPPTWDVLSEDHVRYGCAVASSSLSDSGWLLIMASTSGLAAGLIDRYCRVSGLEIWHRVWIVHHSAYGYMDLARVRIKCSTSMLYFVHRLGMDPPLHFAASTSQFQSLCMSPLETMVFHHLPVDGRAIGADGSVY